MLDTSGPALAATLEAGPAFVIKPSLGEFRALVGAAVETDAEIAAAAAALRATRGVELVAVTLGQDGALLAGPEGLLRLRPPDLPVASATGQATASSAGWSTRWPRARPRRRPSRWAWRRARRRC